MVAEVQTVSHRNRNNQQRLRADVVPRATVDDSEVDAMYRLYARHYSETSPDRFLADLANKSDVLLLRGEAGELCGFTTLEIYHPSHAGLSCQVIYSGDTIIDPAYWGGMEFSIAWLRFVRSVKMREPEQPLYWLLIVKGHRTYRYLSTFARRYTPHHTYACAFERELLNRLAVEKFGPCFDPDTGIAKFGSNAGKLSPELVTISREHLRRSEVAYFVQRNPGYVDGDELVCLSEISEQNLRPFARRVYLNE